MSERTFQINRRLALVLVIVVLMLGAGAGTLIALVSGQPVFAATVRRVPVYVARPERIRCRWRSRYRVGRLPWGLRQWSNRCSRRWSTFLPHVGEDALLCGSVLQRPLFRQFFGDQGNVPRERREQALGLGVIVSPDGYILTNNHVIDGATDIKVSLRDKREFAGHVIGRDPKTDVAIVKIDATGLPSATLGDSAKLQVGDYVLAIGDPFGIGETVTNGIVSATGRGGLDIENYEDFIQTDAPINPGNSGGALINARGQLVGINTAMLSSNSGGYQGIGFAVPINMARYVMEQILDHGKVVPGMVGSFRAGCYPGAG